MSAKTVANFVLLRRYGLKFPIKPLNSLFLHINNCKRRSALKRVLSLMKKARQKFALINVTIMLFPICCGIEQFIIADCEKFALFVICFASILENILSASLCCRQFPLVNRIFPLLKSTSADELLSFLLWLVR